MKALLNVRKIIKSKKPEFSRQDSHKKPKLGSKWRRPKGLQSKMRLAKRGYKRSPEVGWGSPVAVRGLSKEGLVFQNVNTLSEVASLDAKKDIAVIGSTVGTRKKIILVKALVEKKIAIYDLKNPEEFLSSVEKDLQTKRAEKEKAQKEKEKKKKESEKKEKKQEEEKKDLSDDVKEEDHKKEEKATKDKIITKKE